MVLLEEGKFMRYPWVISTFVIQTSDAQTILWVGGTDRQTAFQIHFFLPDSFIIFLNMQHDYIRCMFAVSGTLSSFFVSALVQQDQ